MDVKSQTAGLAAQALTSPLEDQDIDNKDKSSKFKLIRYFSNPTFIFFQKLFVLYSMILTSTFDIFYLSNI